MSGVSVKNQINPSESLFHEKIFKLGDQLLFVGQFYYLKLICLCISDDVQLKYEKKGVEVWVSLDQYK